MDVLFTGWLDWMRDSKGSQPKTLALYTRILETYEQHVLGEGSFEAVTTEAVEKWLQRPRDGRARGQTASPATQARDSAVVRGFYEWACSRGHLTRNPAARGVLLTPPIRNIQPKPIGDDTWLRLACVNNVHSRVALGLMFFCGLRREELTRLRCSNVDLGRRQLVGFTRKGGGEDTLPVSTILDVFMRKLPHLTGAESLWADLDGVVRERPGSSFVITWADLGRPQRRDDGGLEPGQLDPQHVNHWLDRTCGSQRAPHVHPHQLRHSCATNLLRAGVPIAMVSNVLNHGNITTTMRYVKVGGDELGEWLSRS